MPHLLTHCCLTRVFPNPAVSGGTALTGGPPSPYPYSSHDPFPFLYSSHFFPSLYSSHSPPPPSFSFTSSTTTTFPFLCCLHPLSPSSLGFSHHLSVFYPPSPPPSVLAPTISTTSPCLCSSHRPSTFFGQSALHMTPATANGRRAA